MPCTRRRGWTPTWSAHAGVEPRSTVDEGAGAVMHLVTSSDLESGQFLHRPRGVALLAGQFDVSDPLFKRELRLEFEDYQIYRVRVGDTGADLTYDRGLMALVSPWKGGDVAIQVLNGRGLSAAGENRQYDRDPWKNVALRYSHEFGPLRLGGSAPRSSTACATGSRSGLPTSP